jgi:hypothetical protein
MLSYPFTTIHTVRTLGKSVWLSMVFIQLFSSGCSQGLLFNRMNVSATSSKKSKVTSGATSSVADGLTPLAVTVTLQDSSGNVVAGKSVSLNSSRAGSDTITPTSSVTNSSGQASFSVTSQSVGNSTFTAIDNSDAINIASSASVIFSTSLVFNGSVTEYSFGTIGVSTVKMHPVLVANLGQTTISNLAITGLASPFSYGGGVSANLGTYPGVGGTCGTMLAAGTSCVIVFAYNAPGSPTQSQQSQHITLSYQSPLAQTAGLDLEGTATNNAYLQISDNDPSYYVNYPIVDDSTFSFGTAGLNTGVDHTFSVTNTGGGAASSLADASGFSGNTINYKDGAFPGTGGDCSVSGTLAVGSTCTAVVTFAPPSSATFTSYLSLNYGGGSSTTTTATRSLSGTGSTGPSPKIYDYSNGGTGPGINISAVYDFGTIGVGQNSPYLFYIWNGGGSAVTGLNGKFSTGDFSFTNGAFPGATAGTLSSGPGSQNGVVICGSTLNANAACMVSVTYRPTAVGPATGLLNLSSNSGNFSRPIRGSGTTSALLSIRHANGNGPSSFYHFGYVSTSALVMPTTQFTVTNIGYAPATGMTDPNLTSGFFTYTTGTYPGGSVTAGFCGTTLAPGASCTLSVQFTASGNDTISGAINVTYAGGSTPSTTATFSLLGTSTSKAIVSISNCTPGNDCGHGGTPTFDYGYVAAGSYKDQIFYVTNMGASTSFSADTISATEFSYSNGSFPGTSSANGYSACMTPTLSANATCIISVRYTAPNGPTSSSTQHLNLSGLNNAPGSNAAINLTGTPTSNGIISLQDTISSPASNSPYFYGTVGQPASYIFILQNTGGSGTSVTLTDGGTLGSGFAYPIGYGFPGGTPATPTGSTGVNFCSSPWFGTGATQNCGIAVTFTPSGESTSSSVLTVNLTGATASSVSRYLTATSTDHGFLALTPGSCTGASCSPTFTFPNTMHGTTTTPQTFTVTNTGALAVNSINITGTNPSIFVVTSNTCTSLSVGSTCSFTVTFSPSSAQPYSATLSVSGTDSSVAPVYTNENLLGTGN